MDSTKKIKQLVIDSGAFLKNVPVWEYGEEFFSVSEVLHEIRDKNAKAFIKAFPYEIKWLQPKPESIKFINDFTKETGEFKSLSLADVKVLALTYDLEVEAKGDDHLRKKPVQKKVEEKVSSKPPPSKQLEGFYSSSSNRNSNKYQNKNLTDKSSTKLVFKSHVPDTEGDENGPVASDVSSPTEAIASVEDITNVPAFSDVPSVTEADPDVSSITEAVLPNAEDNISVPVHFADVPSVTEVTEDIESLSISQQESCTNENDEAESSENDDDDEGWITPSNIKSLKGKEDSVCEEDYKDVQVACISGDFAIQNTLLHIGLSAIGIKGKLIKILRMYMLKCFVCGNLSSDYEKIFCYKCGYKTLRKVPYTIKPDGTKHIWESNRPINKKGMKYSLPAPKGGKHAVNPLLCADQRFPQNRPTKRSLQRNDPMHEDYLARAGDTPFLPRDIYSRAEQLGIVHKLSKHRGAYYWEKRNPNDPGKNLKSRRKC